MEIRPYAPADWPRIEAVHDAARKIELHQAGLDGAFLPLSIAAQREGLFDYTILVAQDTEVPGPPPPGNRPGSGPGRLGANGAGAPDRGSLGRQFARSVLVPFSGIYPGGNCARPYAGQ